MTKPLKLEKTIFYLTANIFVRHNTCLSQVTN